MIRYISEEEKRQKKTIPIGYNLRKDVVKGGRHGFLKIGILSGRQGSHDIIMDRSNYRKWKYYIVHRKTGKVLKRSHSLDEIWKGVKK